MKNRFQFVPFWELTQWGFLAWCAFRINDGCDEWHNKSHYIVIPLVGELVLFDKGMDRSGEEHLGSYGPDGWEGADHSPDCDICVEIKEAISSH